MTEREGTFTIPTRIFVTEAQRAKVLRQAAGARRFVPIPVIENLTWDEFARVNVNSPDLPGIQPEVGHIRTYPEGPVMVHAIGYVGAGFLVLAVIAVVQSRR